MTRKDYIRLSDVVNKAQYDKAISERSRKAFARSLAATLKADNQRFDSARFFDACQVKAKG